MKLQQVSAVDLSFVSGNHEHLEEGYFTQTTEEALVEAFRAYRAQWDETIEDEYKGEERDRVYNVIWELVRAYQQYAHEAGVRFGIRLMNDAMNNPVPTIELERKVLCGTLD